MGSKTRKLRRQSEDTPGDKRRQIIEAVLESGTLKQQWSEACKGGPLGVEPIAVTLDLDDRDARVIAESFGEQARQTIKSGRRLLTVLADRADLHRLLEPFAALHIVEALATPRPLVFRMVCLAFGGAMLLTEGADGERVWS